LSKQENNNEHKSFIYTKKYLPNSAGEFVGELILLQDRNDYVKYWKLNIFNTLVVSHLSLLVRVDQVEDEVAKYRRYFFQ